MRIEAPRSLWSERDARAAAAAATPPELGLRVYASRLLGRDPSLVFAGGGNTSVKATTRDLFGEPVETLFVKGSGADLARATERDFAPLALAPARRLLELPALSDRALAGELLRLRLDPGAPTPSVETLLHAFLPHRYVDHAHPVALLALLDCARAGELVAELYAGDCLVVPYVKPGFDLARAVRRLWQRETARGRRFRGIVLEKHGVVAFADDARESYETLVELVARAAERLPRRPRRPLRPPRARRPPGWAPLDLARLRAAVSRAAGRPLAAALRADRAALGLLDRRDLGRIVRRGPLTPDHALRTGHRPLVVRSPEAIAGAVERFVGAARAEFTALAAGRALAPLDPAPRVALVPGTGIVGFAPTPGEAEVAAGLALQTAWAIERAEALGGYRPLGRRQLFEVETWEPERAKRERAASPGPLGGRVALVTGAASGIGRASAEALLAQGAAVVGLDLRAAELPGDFAGVVGDARDRRAIRRALALAVERFGGLDVAVANAGVFFAGPAIAETSDEAWRKTLAIDLDAQFLLLAEAAPFLEVAPAGGAVVLVGSKNVAAPGPGAAAYSAAKAAATQLARVAALELGPKGVRVNVVHPDAVFDTGVWAGGMLAARAAKYGLSVEAYRKRNVLGREVTAADVGALVAALASDLFAKTTGAQIPVDGGNERVI